MKLISILLIFGFLVSCTNDDVFIPKPPTYLRADLPEHKYTTQEDECPYTLTIPEIFSTKQVSDLNGPTCHKDINMGPLNGTIHFSFIAMTEPLAAYVNFANDKVDEHKIKATSINDYKIINDSNRVYCTLFELQGNVASPFQFYMTDSTSKFVSGVVYFNSTPNYDSLKPSLDYLKADLNYMIENFKWK
ncbi:MAG: hypothetical protein P8N52_04115 [Crocinitomicaceae bacterium]|nr:hypothetical protein [Crocinitomicaceae bacterium]MDG1776430.1 hypothetical protein [Crocinitomicaceae bacterium]